MRRHFVWTTAFALACGGLLPAQNPMDEIQEIARAVEQQLQEIDRLLLESGKQNQARSRPQEMLEQASERGAAVQDGIDKLIEKLTDMKNQSGQPSSSGDGEPQPQPQGQGQPRPQGQPQNRRENETPDFVQQPKPGEQEQQGQKPEPQGQQPQVGQDAATTPENRAAQAPPEGETGPGQGAQGTETWGELQPYVNFLKNRGASPKVPEKFRKYWEAYLKQKQDERR